MNRTDYKEILAARPLDLKCVRLLGGPLKHAQDLDAEYLLKLESDRMLSYYRQRTGLKGKAESYTGWDGGGRNLTSHIAGHYLSAVSLMWAATGDKRERADYIVREFKEIQNSIPLANFSQLVSVPDITVETVVGHLPRLPYHIPGFYRNNAKGPMVRVIWPAPVNNAQVLKAGTYTLRGTVPGTKFKPTATVSVKAAFDTDHVPHRNVEPFPLSQVVLNQYENDRDSPFIKNRDKFIRTLAKTNPDSFLYNFRDAFG